jgi:hypothetical protein
MGCHEETIMTIPVRAGQNACYGYEEDSNDASSGAPPNACASVRLTCEPETTAMPPPVPAQQPSTAPPPGCAIEADYYSVSGSAGFYVQAAGSATIDRYGNIYTAGGGGVGAGVGGSIVAGYLRDPDHPCEPPDEETLRSFLSGPAVTVGVSAGLAIEVAHSSGMNAVEVGVGIAGAGASYTLGARIGD